MNAKVHIDAKRINQDNTPFFKNLEQKITTLLNQTHWTQDVFREEEKIESSWTFTLSNSDLDAGRFSGYLQINTQRPVFRTTYQSPLLLLNDENLSFNYWEDDFLEYREGFRNDNLVSLLSFYTYIILGFDYDSFGPASGEWAYQKAQEIFLTSQYLGARGWEQKGLRYSYIDQYAVAGYLDFRKTLYLYHRLGMDYITQDREKTRDHVLLALEQLKKITQDFSYLSLIYNFVQNKEQEIIQLFDTASREKKDAIYRVIQVLDFKRLKRYDQLLK